MAGNLINSFSIRGNFTRQFSLLQEILESQRGIMLLSENIQATFSHADINLKASIKRIDDIKLFN